MFNLPFNLQEMVGDHKADFYNVHGIKVISVKRYNLDLFLFVCKPCCDIIISCIILLLGENI